MANLSNRQRSASFTSGTNPTIKKKQRKGNKSAKNSINANQNSQSSDAIPLNNTNNSASSSLQDNDTSVTTATISDSAAVTRGRSQSAPLRTRDVLQGRTNQELANMLNTKYSDKLYISKDTDLVQEIQLLRESLDGTGANGVVRNLDDLVRRLGLKTLKEQGNALLTELRTKVEQSSPLRLPLSGVEQGRRGILDNNIWDQYDLADNILNYLSSKDLEMSSDELVDITQFTIEDLLTELNILADGDDTFNMEQALRDFSNGLTEFDLGTEPERYSQLNVVRILMQNHTNDAIQNTVRARDQEHNRKMNELIGQLDDVADVDALLKADGTTTNEDLSIIQSKMRLHPPDASLLDWGQWKGQTAAHLGRMGNIPKLQGYLQQMESFLPQILENEQTYSDSHYVFYHAQEGIYRALRRIVDLQQGLDNSNNFTYLRDPNTFPAQSRPYEEEAKEWPSTIEYWQNKMSSGNDAGGVGIQMVSANMSVFGNFLHDGEATVKWFLDNTNVSDHSKDLLQKLIEELGITGTNVRKFGEALVANKAKGASLLQIFVPKNMASELAYLSVAGGRPIDANFNSYMDNYQNSPDDLGPALDYMQARLIMSHEAFSNPKSGVMIFDHNAMSAAEEQEFDDQIRNLLTTKVQEAKRKPVNFPQSIRLLIYMDKRDGRQDKLNRRIRNGQVTQEEINQIYQEETAKNPLQRLDKNTRKAIYDTRRQRGSKEKYMQKYELTEEMYKQLTSQKPQ